MSRDIQVKYETCNHEKWYFFSSLKFVVHYLAAISILNLEWEVLQISLSNRKKALRNSNRRLYPEVLI